MGFVTGLEIRDGDITVAVDPSFGNNAFSMTVRGHPILYTPPDFRSKPALGFARR